MILGGEHTTCSGLAIVMGLQRIRRKLLDYFYYYYYYYWRKQITRGRYNTTLFFSLILPLVQSRTWMLRRQRLARRKSPILTAQTTRLLRKKWPRDELWWVSIWHAFKIRLYDTLWCDISFWSGRVVWAVKIGDFRLARCCRRSIQVRLCTSGCMSEKNGWCHISPAFCFLW